MSGSTVNVFMFLLGLPNQQKMCAWQIKQQCVQTYLRWDEPGPNIYFRSSICQGSCQTLSTSQGDLTLGVLWYEAGLSYSPGATKHSHNVSTFMLDSGHNVLRVWFEATCNGCILQTLCCDGTLSQRSERHLCESATVDVVRRFLRGAWIKVHPSC